jgi:hypothetical protein
MKKLDVAFSFYGMNPNNLLKYLKENYDDVFIVYSQRLCYLMAYRGQSGLLLEVSFGRRSVRVTSYVRGSGTKKSKAILGKSFNGTEEILAMAESLRIPASLEKA